MTYNEALEKYETAVHEFGRIKGYMEALHDLTMMVKIEELDSFWKMYSKNSEELNKAAYQVGYTGADLAWQKNKLARSAS